MSAQQITIDHDGKGPVYFVDMPGNEGEHERNDDPPEETEADSRMKLGKAVKKIKSVIRICYKRPDELRDSTFVAACAEVRRQSLAVWLALRKRLVDALPKGVKISDIEAEMKRLEKPQQKRVGGAKILTLVPSSRSKSQGEGLLMDRFGAPISCALNAQIWLDQMPRRFAKNEFTLQQCMDGKPIEDETHVSLLVEIQRSRRVNLRKEHLIDGLTMVCSKNKFHPVTDWFDSLSWDGTPRISKFLHVCMGVQDSSYSRATSLSLFMSAVSRAYAPGCQVDTMLVLEGDQGAGKSSAIIALFSEEWHTEVSCDVRDKDFYQNLRGKLCVEFGEMSGISLADSSHIKDMLTKRIDTYRASYARTSSDYPRQNIFIGTTNDDAYLRDATGERRYLPVKTGKIRLDWIANEREQLWAEAVAAFKAGTYQRWYDVPDAAEEQDKRHMVDPWEEAIANALHYRESCTSTYLLSDVIGLKLQDHGQREKNRVSAILKRLGWTCKKERVEGEPLPVRLYRPKPPA